MTQNRVTWNTEKATQLWLEGQTASDIAAAVGAPSRSAILGYMNRMAIVRVDQPGRQSGQRTALAAVFWTEERCVLAQTLWLAGETATAITVALGGGVSRSAVVGRMHRLGLKKPPVVRIAKAQKAKTVSKAGDEKSSTKPDAIAGDTRLVARLESQVAPNGKTLAERGDRECCWPVGRPDPSRGQLFCAAPTGFRQSYCANHSPNQAADLRTMRFREETMRRARPEREASDVELTELFA